ncbi:hypothetical protein [Nannocystis pusilla]|uniref:hypothetical protein n=1 Tax=Nannocystis pusilla TaxID=889268 RepID=UPI003B7B8E8F
MAGRHGRRRGHVRPAGAARACSTRRPGWGPGPRDHLARARCGARLDHAPAAAPGPRRRRPDPERARTALRAPRTRSPAPALTAALPPGDTAFPWWICSHAALGERLTHVEQLDKALAQALAAIHARGLGVIVDLETHWPPAGRSFVAAPTQIDLEPFRALAERGLRAIGELGVLELAQLPDLACPRPAVRGAPHPLPVSSPDDSAALTTDPRHLYWRWVQPDWELALVRSLFPYVGRGFRIDLVSTRWDRDAIRGELRATFAEGEPTQRPLVVPRALLDGVRVGDGWHRRPLAEDGRRIDEWRDALARADADAVRAGHVPWSFVRPGDDRGPTRPIERHELPGASVKARHLDRLVLSAYRPDTTWVIDTTSLAAVTIDGLFLHSADVDARGTLHALARLAGETRLRVGEWDLSGPLDALAARPFRAGIDPGIDASVLRRLGDRSLVAASHTGPDAAPRWSDGTPLALPATDAPFPAAFEARAFRDGSALVIAGGRAHRLVWSDGAPQATLLPCDALGVELPFDAPPAVLDDDGEGMLLLAGRALCRLRSDGSLTRLFPSVENIMTLARGPGDAVLVSQGHDVDGDIAKVLWLATGEITHLRPDLLDLPDAATFVCFLAARFALWCQFHRDVRVVPWELVEALPRARHEPAPPDMLP